MFLKPLLLYLIEFSAPLHPPAAGFAILDLKAPSASRTALSNRIAENSCVGDLLTHAFGDFAPQFLGGFRL